MPVSQLSPAQRDRLPGFGFAEEPLADLRASFGLTPIDRALVFVRRGAMNRLGVAVQSGWDLAGVGVSANRVGVTDDNGADGST